jgi:hypothetical protein
MGPYMRTDPVNTIRILRTMPLAARWGQKHRLHRSDRPPRHTRNAIRLPLRGTHRFTLYSTPTRLQEAIFRLLQGYLGREFPAILRLDLFAVGWAYLEDQLRQFRPLASTTAARVSSEMSVARVLRRCFASRAFMFRAERAASVHSRASSRYSSRCWVSSVSSAALAQFSAWYS